MADTPPPFDELPELTLSLRSFGSRRRSSQEGSAISEEQERYFAPLLDARRNAAGVATARDVVASFDARRILALVDATLRAFAAERFVSRAPARRAFEAELFEIAEPFRQALRLLGERMSDMHSQSGDVRSESWTAWLAQLRVVFRAADDSWPPLGAALEVTPAETSRRWLGKRPPSAGGGRP